MKLLVRYKQYLDMTCKGIVKPSTMAPTERTAFYHGLRVHLRIITWKVLDNTEIEWCLRKCLMNGDGIGKAINYFQLWLIWMLLQNVYWRWYDAVVNRHHKISVEQIYAAAVSMCWNVYQLVGSALGKVVKIKR